MIGNGISIPVDLCISFTHAKCEGVLSIDSPSNSQSLFLNSGYNFAKAIISVVHIGVKSPWVAEEY